MESKVYLVGKERKLFIPTVPKTCFDSNETKLPNMLMEYRQSNQWPKLLCFSPKRHLSHLNVHCQIELIKTRLRIAQGKSSSFFYTSQHFSSNLWWIALTKAEKSPIMSNNHKWFRGISKKTFNIDSNCENQLPKKTL